MSSSELDLHIVTPCVRAGNLEAIARSIQAAAVPDGVALHWLVVLDDRFGIDVESARRAVSALPGARLEVGQGSGPGEYAQCNLALELIRDGWIAFLDDDNLLHPALPSRLAETLRAHPSAGAIVFDQDLGDGIRRAAPENVRMGRIDSGQFAVSRAFAGDERFRVYTPSADGAFIESLHRRDPRRFVFVSEVLASYNALTPGRFGQVPLGRLKLGPLPDTHTAGSLYFHRTSATPEKVRLASDFRGERLHISADGSMASPIPKGSHRLTGRAWLDPSSTAPSRLTIKVANAGADLVSIDVKPPLLPYGRVLSSISTRRVAFDVNFEAPADAEVELSFHSTRGRAIVVIALQILEAVLSA